LICHSVRTEREKAEAYAIRHEVFVKEQKLFEESDVDANDAVGTLLVAKKRSTIIGTVRIYPAGDREKGPWIGGRLAVRRGHRVSMAGALLVKEAMKRVKKKGCTRFTAHIQESNVPFFEKLGWKPVGALENYVSRPHQLMEADLGQVPEGLN
jgi:putative N-acetyltransferase (TIGR04045 family)